MPFCGLEVVVVVVVFTTGAARVLLRLLRRVSGEVSRLTVAEFPLLLLASCEAI